MAFLCDKRAPESASLLLSERRPLKDDSSNNMNSDSLMENSSVNGIIPSLNTAKQKRKSFANLAATLSPQNFRTKGGLLRKNSTSEAHLNQSEENDGKNALYCDIRDSPFYIFKACSHGLSDVVLKLLDENPKLIELRDSKKSTCLHIAAGRGKILIVDILVDRGADVNSLNADGNTPLHMAVEKSQLAMVKHLLVTHKANGKIKNNAEMPPLFTAVALNKPEIVEALLSFPNLVDINQDGPGGKKAVHLAAKLDHSECAFLLMKSSCKLDKKCKFGYTPLHLAAKACASKTLDLILCQDICPNISISNEALLNMPDRERNTPLHLAVNSGDLETVRVCLKHGAKVDTMQESSSTALHFACAQGTVAIVRMLFEAHLEQMSAETGSDILNAKDVLNMTPLHRAAMYDHDDVVKYLVEQKSSLDELDNERRTPLLLAAVRGGSKSFRTLLNAGADFRIRDKDKRNVLHYLVIYATYESSLFSVIEQICRISEDGQELLNQKDITGCTPLHIASREGNLKFTEALIRLGAIVNLKNNEDQSPLHFAATYGRYNTVRRLLETGAGPNIINETDRNGMTALHVASKNGHTKVVQLLLCKGAIIHKDFSDRSALHLASISGYKDTAEMLLSFHSNLLDQKCKNGNTALHYVTEYNHASLVDYFLSKNCQYTLNNDKKTPLDVAIEHQRIEPAISMIQHDRWNEILTTFDSKYGCPVHSLIQHMPEVSKVVLDRSVTYSEDDPGSHPYWQKFDFRYMQTDSKCIKSTDENKVPDQNFKPLASLNTMVKFGRVELLSHPLCLNYLRMKWLAYGFWVFFMNMLFYTCFVILLTNGVITWHRNFVYGHNGTNETVITSRAESNALYFKPVMLTSSCRWTLLFVFLFAFVNLLKEIGQIYYQRVHYFSDMINYMEWTLYISSCIFSFPVFYESDAVRMNWQCGSIAVFLAWLNLLFYLQRLDSVGLYVVMFRHILNTIVKVIMVFSVLFIAFGLTFYLLLWTETKNDFKTPFTSVLQSVMFMMGEWNYVDVFVEPYLNGTFLYATLSFTFLVIFVVLMSLLFINLLIGLAVGDIEVVRRNANLKRLAMQVDYHTDLEKRLPVQFLKKVDRKELVIYPNGCSKNSLLLVLSKFRFLFGRYDYALFSSFYDTGDSVQNEKIFLEINRTKNKLQEMQNQFDRMHDLLRLVVQKMEIVEEADHYDERKIFKPPTEGVPPYKARLRQKFVPSTKLGMKRSSLF